MKNKKNFIEKIYGQLNRYREVFFILVKHGFEDLLNSLNLQKIFSLEKKIFKKGKKERQKYTRWERIRMVIEELGPTFIKFGQVMSNRPDLLPKRMIEQLKKLRAEVSPFDTEKAINIIQKELTNNIDEIFVNIDKKPFAAASIAQVHKAELKTGEEVIIKVQRPGIERIIKKDIDIMYTLSRLIERYISKASNFDLVGIVEEFEKSINKELNFLTEIQHIERFRTDFKNDDKIYIPKVYTKYSTQKIITMEYIKGESINEFEEIENNERKKQIAENIVESMLVQIFENSFFHADPHHGNILVLEDNRICFLDFGLAAVIHSEHKNIFADIMIGFIKKDEKKVAKSLIKLSRNKRINDIKKFEMQLFEMIEKYHSIPLSSIHIGKLLNEMVNMIISYDLKFSPNIYLLVKALMNIENIARNLYPDFDMISHIKPFAKKLIRKRINPIYIIKKVFNSSIDYLNLFADLPLEVRNIITRIKEGEFKIVMEHKGMDEFLKKNDQISNRISFSIVLASLIIGSSLIVLADIPPKWNNISLIGLIGFLAAGILGFWLLISILKHGKM